MSFIDLLSYIIGINTIKFSKNAPKETILTCISRVTAVTGNYQFSFVYSTPIVTIHPVP